MGAAKRDWERQSELGWSPGADTFVCGDCLCDDALAEVVAAHLKSTECSYCGREGTEPIAAPLDAVTERMAACINREWTDPVDELPWDKGYVGRVLDAGELLQEIGFSVSSGDLFNDVAEAFTGHDWCERNYFAASPEDRWNFGWERFKRAVKHKRRFTFWSMGDEDNESYHPDRLPVGNMLAEIASAISRANLEKVLPTGKVLWRVRVHDTECMLAQDHELSPPPLEKQLQSNRMSPAGIVMFYGAEDFETACVETVSPERDGGRSVTGAAFRAVRQMRILDLSELPFVPSFFDATKAELRHVLSFLHDFAHDLAQPISSEDVEHIEYVPTQAFTEYVRFEMRTADNQPFDGIRYSSSINRKPCYALFCEQDNCIQKPRGYRVERWLEFVAGSIRTVKLDGG